MAQRVFLILIAGAVGAACRYGLSGLVQKFANGAYPWGTFAVSLTGCLLAGLLWGLLEGRWHLPAEIRVAVFVGFLGAFTTFSTFILETAELLRAGEWSYAAANVVLHVVGGLAGFVMAFFLGRSL